MMNNCLLSSKSNEWGTPQWLFDQLNEKYNFTLDPCATPQNAKCQKYFTKEQDGLKQEWRGEIVFCNPPYGREIPKWVKKAYEERQRATIVMLIPARTDTIYFHDYILGNADLQFLRGRLCFNDGNGRAPFPSMIVVFKAGDVNG
jgi:site-specific DNA-methyltransferase (adenine-specific)